VQCPGPKLNFCRRKNGQRRGRSNLCGRFGCYLFDRSEANWEVARSAVECAGPPVAVAALAEHGDAVARLEGELALALGREVVLQHHK
jgi:hypothetical protein